MYSYNIHSHYKLIHMCTLGYKTVSDILETDGLVSSESVFDAKLVKKWEVACLSTQSCVILASTE